MNRYKVTYSSMTAFYDFGYMYGDSQEDVEREARARATAFTPGERALIHARIANNDRQRIDED